MAVQKGMSEAKAGVAEAKAGVERAQVCMSCPVQRFLLMAAMLAVSRKNCHMD